MSSKIVRRAVMKLREQILPLSLLPQWANWVNQNSHGYFVHVSHTASRVYSSTLMVSGHVKALAAQKLITNVFRLDFTHTYTQGQKGVIGSVVAKLGEHWNLPCILLHAASNETLELWKKLIQAVLDHFAVPTIVLVTDGFAGLANLISEMSSTYEGQLIHVRCIHHLADSCQKLLKGKSIPSELWQASREIDVAAFTQTIHKCWLKNPAVTTFLCPTVVSTFTAPTDTSLSQNSAELFDKMAELGIQRISFGPIPCRADLISLIARLVPGRVITAATPSAELHSFLIDLIAPPLASSSSETTSTHSSSSNTTLPDVASDSEQSEEDTTEDTIIEEDALGDTSELAPIMEFLFENSEPPQTQTGLYGSQAETFSNIAASMPLIWTSWQVVLKGSSCYHDCSTNSVESWNSSMLKERRYLPTGAQIAEIFHKMIRQFYSFSQRLASQLRSDDQHTFLDDWELLLLTATSAQPPSKIYICRKLLDT